MSDTAGLIKAGRQLRLLANRLLEANCSLLSDELTAACALWDAAHSKRSRGDRPRISAVPPPTKSERRLTGLYAVHIAQLKPSSDQSVFFPLAPADDVDVLRSRIISSCAYHGWKISARVRTENGAHGLRVWRKT